MIDEELVVYCLMVSMSDGCTWNSDELILPFKHKDSADYVCDSLNEVNKDEHTHFHVDIYKANMSEDKDEMDALIKNIIKDIYH